MKKLSDSARLSFAGLVHLLAVTYKDRIGVPPTREEILYASKGSKKDLKDLTQLGLIQGTLLGIRENGKNGSGGAEVSRNCYELTKLGEDFALHLGLNVPQNPTVAQQRGSCLREPWTVPE